MYLACLFNLTLSSTSAKVSRSEFTVTERIILSVMVARCNMTGSRIAVYFLPPQVCTGLTRLSTLCVCKRDNLKSSRRTFHPAWKIGRLWAAEKLVKFRTVSGYSYGCGYGYYGSEGRRCDERRPID